MTTFPFCALVQHTGGPRQSVPADSTCQWPVISLLPLPALWVRSNFQKISLAFHHWLTGISHSE